MPNWDSFEVFLSEVTAEEDHEKRQQMVDDLLFERGEWPWIEGAMATFAYNADAESVALNLDIIKGDPPFASMTRLDGTTLWYLQREFDTNDLLDYVLAVDDPMTPLAQESNILQRITEHWQVDSLNPTRMGNGQMDVSILRMPDARPFPDWRQMPGVPRGQVYEHAFNSVKMNFVDRLVWVYVPPGYDQNDKSYPLLLLLDGQWMVGPIQVPQIADALTKHNRIEPAIIAMIQSGRQTDRIKDYVSNDDHHTALVTELLPFLQGHYRIDGNNIAIGGVGVGAVAAAHSSLKDPEVFSRLMMLSPPLGKGLAQEKLIEYGGRFDKANKLPRRIFQSVGRYEMTRRFYRPGIALSTILQRRTEVRGDVAYRFVELGSGHGLVAFRSIFPEALAHIFPSVTV